MHKALFELHKQQPVKEKEELVGLISLNYDNVLDTAYREYYGNPRYCFEPGTDPATIAAIPLLKLHGSFGWKNQIIHGRKRDETFTSPDHPPAWTKRLPILDLTDSTSRSGAEIGTLALNFRATNAPSPIQAAAITPTVNPTTPVSGSRHIFRAARPIHPTPIRAVVRSSSRIRIASQESVDTSTVRASPHSSIPPRTRFPATRSAASAIAAWAFSKVQVPPLFQLPWARRSM